MKPSILLLLSLAYLLTVASSPASAEHYPDPQFAGNVRLDRTEITLGESIVLAASLINANPFYSPGEGRIVVSFPGFTTTEDHNLVADAGSSTNEVDGYVETPAGETIFFFNECSTLTAQYLVVEFIDSDWESEESNLLRVRVTPTQAGRLIIDVRGQMRQPPGTCNAWVTALPSNGAGGFEDQQRGPVKRFEVLVKSSVPTKRLSWGRIKAKYSSGP